MFRIVGRVPTSVSNRDLLEIERRYALEAGGIDAKLGRVGAAAVVRVNTTDFAEMVFRDAGVETVGGKLVGTLSQLELGSRRR